MPHVRADISFFIEIGPFHNIDLFQRGYYQVRYYLKAGNSASPVNNFGQSTIAIYPPVVFGENSTASIQYGQNTNLLSSPKGCSSTVLIMYHKESARLSDAFEQQVQVNVDVSQLEDVFKQTELAFCAELWFAEESGSDVCTHELQLLTSRQKRIQMSPTRGLCHHFNLIFDFSHLCAVEFVIQGYLTNILPGLFRSSSLSNNLHSLASYENHAKHNWKDVLYGNSPTSILFKPLPLRTESKRHSAMATHRHLCQTLLSSRERMLIFWHEVAIFLKNGFKPSFEVADLCGLLVRITSTFQQLKTETEMAKQMARDMDTLAGENAMFFHQLCEFIHSSSKVLRHIKRKSHQIRMKRFAEAFFVQELQVPQLLAVYDPAINGHEAMAGAIRQSTYFQRLPELPVSCRQLDGDATNIPIIFEDIYLPLTDAQRNGIVQKPTEIVGPEVSQKLLVNTRDDECIRTDVNNRPASRPHSVLSTSISLTEDPAIADLLLYPSSSSSSLLNHRHLVLRRGQRIVLNEHPRRRNRLSLGLLYKNPVRSEVAGVCGGGIGGNGSSDNDIKLLGYRRIVDDSLECVEVEGNSTVLESQLNGHQEVEEGGDNHPSSPGDISRNSISLLSLQSAENSKPPVQRHLAHQNQTSQTPPRTSRHMEHAISTPNLDLTSLSSNLAAWETAAANGADAVVVERCPRCGLPDFSTVSTFNGINNCSGAKRRASLVTSLSLPSLSSLDPASATAGAMRSASLSDSAGVQVGGVAGTRPTMRRLKQQRRNKSIFTRRRNCGFRNRLSSSAHLYTEDLVNFGSLSDLLNNSCQCKKTELLTQDRRKLHSKSTELCNNASAIIPVTEFGRSRREASNPPTLPSLSEDLRDHEMDMDTDNASSSREHSSKWTDELLPDVAPAQFHLLPEDDQEVGLVDSAADTLEGPNELSHWVMRNPEKAIALAQNKLTRRSLSQTYLTLNGDDEKPLTNHQVMEYSQPVTSVGSTECLVKSRRKSVFEGVGGDRLVNAFAPGTMTFVMLKEHLKQHVLLPPTFKGHIYSDFSQLTVPFPYFSNSSPKSSNVHLVICVHGLEGSSLDLRLLTMYLQLALPDHPLEFLMSESNHEDTFTSLEQLRDNLVQEILYHLNSMPEKPTHISFIGHSLGCVLIRAALASPLLAFLYPQLHTFLSFCGPHLGTLYSTSGLVSMGMWALQKLKKSRSLLQLRLRDHPDPRETFMYALSSTEGIDHFRYLLLVASPQDHYVPHHSSRIELCRAALQDPSEIGTVYMEMLTNILQRIIKSSRTTVVRYDVHYEVQSSANHFIGRAAHIAVLDSDVFMEKFFCASAARYFRCDENGSCSPNDELGNKDSSASPNSLASQFSFVNGG